MNPSSDPKRVQAALRFLAELEAVTAAATAVRPPADELAPRRRRVERFRSRVTGIHQERRVKAL
jgi:hypothetical protein